MTCCSWRLRKRKYGRYFLSISQLSPTKLGATCFGPKPCPSKARLHFGLPPWNSRDQWNGCTSLSRMEELQHDRMFVEDGGKAKTSQEIRW